MNRSRRRRLGIGLAVLGLALGLGACSSDEERFHDHLERAQAMTQERHFSEALLELRNALKIKPTDAETNFRIARVLQAQEKPNEAAFFYGEAYRLDPERVDAAMDQVRLLLSTDPDRAAEIVADAAQRFPDNPYVNIRQAEVALVRGDTEAATAAALRATELAPNEGDPQHTLGMVYQARIREARVAGETPDDDLYRKSIAAFEKADQLFGGSIVSQIQRARVLSVWKGHEEEARTAFRSTVENARKLGDPQMYGAAAQAAFGNAQASKDVDYQRWALEQIVEADDSRIAAWTQLANLDEKAEAGSGEARMRQLVDRRPDDVRARLAYADFLYGRGDVEAGDAYLRDTAEHGVEPAVVLGALAENLVGRGDLAQASEVTARLEHDHPDHPRTQLARGRLAMAQGRAAEAEPILEKLDRDTEMPEAAELLALAQFRLGQVTEATASINRSVQLRGRPTVSQLRLKAQIHEAAGDWTQVMVTLRRLSRLTRGALLPREQVMVVRSFYGRGQAERGRRLLEGLLKQEKPNPLFALEYARREGQAHPDEAYDHLAKALEAAPKEPAIPLAMARIEAQRGETAHALERIDGMVDSLGPRPPLLAERTRLRIETGDLAGAEEDAMRLFETAPDFPGATALVVTVLTKRNRVDQAIASFEEAARVNVLPVPGQALLARLQMMNGNTDRAIELFDKVLAERPQNVVALNDLAYALASQQRDLDRALELAQKAKQLQGDSAAIADTLGYVYLKRGLQPAAIEQFQYAIDRAEQHAEPAAVFRYHLGLALRADGNDAAAAEALEKALAEDADFEGADIAQRELEAAKAKLAGGAGPAS
jgi:uncharacterized protein (TIGR02996 family)